MDLILWRHAEADDLPSSSGSAADDLARSLTARGEKQAVRMAGWLDRQLPEGTRILVSPARRCEQTALALSRKYRVRPELAPHCSADQLLELVQWPSGRLPVLVVGHQPTLGQAIAHLIGLREAECPVRKGGLWWLRSRDRDGQDQTIVVTVQSPETL